MKKSLLLFAAVLMSIAPSYVRMFLVSASPALKADSFSGKATIADSVVIGPGNPDHVEINRRLTELRNEGPENYYGDGEFRASGMSERAIYEMHYRSFAKQIAQERKGQALPPMNLHQTQQPKGRA
jgi:hypothetical protein